MGDNMDELDRFLEKAKTQPRRRCICCSDTRLAAVIVEFLDRLLAGETDVTLNYLHRHYIVPQFGAPRYADSVRHHVRHCLKRDHRTGGSLDE